MNQPILLYRSGSVYANETAAWAALDAVTHKKGQPIVAFYTLSSPVSGHHGSSTIGAIFAVGIGDGVGQYKACTSHDDMLIVAQSLNAHITQFNQMFEYDANHNAIKAKLDFYTTDGKSISAGGIGSGSSASLGALYQLVDVMANSSNTGIEGAVEGSVLAYDATAGKWKAIAQSEILPDMSGYYTKDETDSAINTAKSNLQGQVDTLQALIPATASADNQLADKDFVNSSIATATAEFKGSFTSLDELKATSGNLNDYAFYLHTDNIGNKVVDRYKWTTAGWLYEYTLNNSSFTAEQWAALNSAITATLVQSYNNHLKNSTIHITAAERTAWNNKWDYNEETIKAVKVNAAVSADKATKLATARKIWGRPFDGSADVSGDLKDVRNISASGKATIQGDIVCGGEVVAITGEGTPAGVTDYSALTGKPAINGVTLVSGNNTLAALGIQAAGDYATNSGVTTLLADYADKTFVSNNYVGKSAFNSHTADSDIHITAAERAAWDAKWDYNEATIKAVKVTSASSADSVAWSGIKDKPTNLSAFTNDVGYITGITKSMVEGVLTGNITSHTHTFASLTSKPDTLAGYGITDAYTSSTIDSKLSGYLPLSGGTISTIRDVGLFINRVTDKPKIGFTKDGSILGFIGFNANSEAIAQIGTGNENTLIHSGNIGSQSVNYASSAGNADTLDGYHATQVLTATSSSTDDLNEISVPNILRLSDTNPNLPSTIFAYSNLLTVKVNSADTAWQLLGSYSSDALWFRRGTWYADGTGSLRTNAWKVIAFTDSNVASATKLATARKIWGRPFDGSADVSGDLTNVTSITTSGPISINVSSSKDNNYNEGIRCNLGGSTKWASVVLGGASGSNSGTNIGVYSLLVNSGLFRIRQNITEVLCINTSNNVLIGTTTDNGYKLQVNGSERVYGDLIVDGEVSALVA